MVFPDINSFSANGNIQVFANNTDSGESARNELPHLKSALFASPKLLSHEKWRSPILNMEKSALNNSALKELKQKYIQTIHLSIYLVFLVIWCTPISTSRHVLTALQQLDFKKIVAKEEKGQNKAISSCNSCFGFYSMIILSFIEIVQYCLHHFSW